MEDRVAALIESQQRTKAQIVALVEAQQRTEQQIAALTEAQLRTERRLATLTNDMADVKDFVLDLRYQHRAHAYFAPLIRRTRVLSAEEIDTLLEAANLASMLHVWQLTNGQAIPPHQRENTNDHPASQA